MFASGNRTVAGPSGRAV